MSELTVNELEGGRFQRSLMGDRLAIGLSGLCVLHCRALPLLLSLLPWLVWMHDYESLIHRVLLLAIVPISLVVLMLGRAEHHRSVAVWPGVVAVMCLVSAVLFAELPHSLEVTLTALGSVILIGSHLINMRILRRAATQESCSKVSS